MENELNRMEISSREKPKVSFGEAVFAWCAFALGFIFTHFAFAYFGGIWGGIFWAMFGAFGAVFVKSRSLHVTKTQAVIFAVSEIFCLTPLFSANSFVNFLASVFSFILYFYLTVAISGGELFGKHFILDCLQAVFIRPFENFVNQPRCFFGIFKGKSFSKNILYAFLGIILAVPLTIVVVFLLMRSDAAFENSMDTFFGNLPKISFSIFWEILFAIPIAMYLFGAVFSAQSGAPKYREGAPEYRIIPGIIAYVATTPICIFYFAYVIAQIQNIANALEKTLNYSEFARRGFFELCAIAVINLGVIVLMQSFAKRKEYDKKTAALRVYTILLSFFTLMIIATALTKMFMYIGEFGMTLLRVYTSWFMILLAFIFVLIIILQVRDFVIWKPLFAGFTLLFAVLCFGNFEGKIAQYNISAYRSGALEELDAEEFYELGFSAVKPASELLESVSDGSLRISKVQEERLITFLLERKHADEAKPKFAYFSIPRAQAQAAEERIEELLK